MAALDQLTGLVNLMGMFQDKETTTSTKGTKSSTTQTNISDKGVMQLVDQILSGPGGVASIGNAARRSGLYNSTTEEKALGELYSDAAVKAELARSPTTTKESSDVSSTTAQEGMGGLGGLGGLIGGGMLLNSLFGGSTGKGGLGGLFGGGGGAGGGLDGVLSGLFGGGGAGGISGSPSAAVGTYGPEALKMLSGAGGGAATGGGGGFLSGLLGGGGAGGAAGGLGSLSGMIPYGGAFLGGLLGGQGEGSAKTEDYLGSVTSGAMTGMAVGGPYGALAGALLGGLGVGTSDMSVICTALNKRGLISNELFKAGHRHLATMDTEIKYGYYIWATPIADKINAGSKFWRYAMLVPTWCYLTLMASNQGVLDYLENPIGAVLKLVGEPFCKLLFRAKLFLQMHTKVRN